MSSRTGILSTAPWAPTDRIENDEPTDPTDMNEPSDTADIDDPALAKDAKEPAESADNAESAERQLSALNKERSERKLAIEGATAVSYVTGRPGCPRPYATAAFSPC